MKPILIKVAPKGKQIEGREIRVQSRNGLLEITTRSSNDNSRVYLNSDEFLDLMDALKEAAFECLEYEKCLGMK